VQAEEFRQLCSTRHYFGGMFFFAHEATAEFYCSVAVIIFRQCGAVKLVPIFQVFENVDLFFVVVCNAVLSMFSSYLHLLVKQPLKTVISINYQTKYIDWTEICPKVILHIYVAAMDGYQLLTF